ncbi:mediator of RNA polymerase II transcription subunit 28 [Culicoides brevitarsis]|uniref:mediator of RNA polymerase II transcription subunit 28 n=1 Tax=Culicoides brevitarsis TaxID=469753 RepID=UPI00307CBFA7
MANSGARATQNLFDEFEEAFQNCIHSLSKEETTTGEDLSEIKQEVDHATLRFVDLGRQMEYFFLQKRFITAHTRPDLVLKEEIQDLKQEIARKDELIKRHFEKIDQWKGLLNDQPTPTQFPKMMPNEGRPMGGLPMQPPAPHMQMSAASSPQMHPGGPGVPPNAPHGMMQMPPQPNPQQQMYMQQAGMRPNFPQGPLAYLEKTTNNIDMVGLGDVRR